MSTQIIFDLDGTLVDTEYQIAAIRAELAQAHGCPVDVKTAFCKYAGRSFKDTFNMIAQTYGQSFSDEKLIQMHEDYQAKKRAMYSDPKLEMIAGVQSLLTRLASNPSFTLSVGSSNSSERTKNVLSAMNLSAYFGERVYGSDLTNGRKKPDPAIFQLALNDFAPQETLVLEDSLPGVEAGRAAGAFVVAYLDPRMIDDCGSREKAYRDAGADLIINSYDQFEALVMQSWKSWPKLDC